MAKIIPALWLSLSLWLSVIAPKAATLAEMVAAYRDAPSTAKRAALEKYAASHAADTEGALANFALGVISWEQKDYSGAVNVLKNAPAQLPSLSDYAAYYLALARVEAKEAGGVAQDLLAAA